MSEMNQRILLAHRPTGEPQASDFRWVETAVPEIGDGQFLVRSHYLSLDPYMRGRMSEAKSYAKPVELGEVMIGDAVGEVLTSHHPKFKFDYSAHWPAVTEVLSQWVSEGKIKYRRR